MHEGVDCGVIITDHKVFDYPAMVKQLHAARRHAQRAEGRDARQHLPAVMQLHAVADSGRVDDRHLADPRRARVLRDDVAARTSCASAA